MNIKHLALALLILPLHGQEPANRFKKVPDLPKSPDDLPVVATNHIEHIEVTKAHLHLWRATHPDEIITHHLVTDWIEQKQATLVKSFFVTYRVGWNYSLDTGHLLTSPVQYTAPRFPNEWPIPISFYLKKLGPSLQAEVSLDKQEQLRARISMKDTRFLSSDLHHLLTKETRSPDDLLLAKFNSYNQTCDIIYAGGIHHLLGIFDSLDDESKALLVFSQAEATRLNAISKSKRPTNPSKRIEVSFELIELPSKNWMDLCEKKTPDQIRTLSAGWIAPLLKNRRATHLRKFSGKTVSGQEIYFNPEGKLITYCDSFKPTDPTKKLSSTNPLVPVDPMSGFRDLFLKVTPQSTSPGHIALSYTWQMHGLEKQLVVHRTFNGSQWIPDATVPFISFLNLKGALFLNPGETTLVGALPVQKNPAQPGSATTRLLFFKAE